MNLGLKGLKPMLKRLSQSTDAQKTVHIFFFTTNLNWQAGRALKFEGNCGVKQTKKCTMLFRVTFKNTSAIINNFPDIWLVYFAFK